MSKTQAVVTRFAPSPTGFLHIGGARTALFNWLYARGRNGKFLLRIEDTDRERSTPEAEAAILEGLTWLGLHWDGEPVSQFARSERHREVVEQLLATGGAFRCYMTPEETEAARDEARRLGRALRSPWRDKPATDEPANTPHTVRFRTPDDGDVIVQDVVQGEVKFPSKDLDDLVLLRSDGAPTYNLAVVVDDHDMGVTHVVRGDDHLANAARQTTIYQALGWSPPSFAHIPLIHGPDGKKLSKRHGALGVEAYRTLGYLPEGLRNYLLRLGWSHGDQELFSDAEAKAAFDITGINKGAARIDFDKMASVNAHHMRQADDQRLLTLVAELLASSGSPLAPELQDRALRAIKVLKQRAKTVVDLTEQMEFALIDRPIVLSAKASKALTDDAIGRISHVRNALAASDEWGEDKVHAILQTTAQELDVGFGKIGAPMRAALTGGIPAPDLAQVLVILGRDESLSRLDDALSQTAA